MDTLRTGGRAISTPNAPEIITGWFERNPPRYYQMRLDRMIELIGEQPGNLEAYDNAGVAALRTGKGLEAVEWIERKQAELDKLPDNDPRKSDHQYRCWSNMGTFLMQNWFEAGSDRSRISELELACDYIRRAIQLNPHAHFGRERYQLMFMEWIVRSPKVFEKVSRAEESPDSTFLPLTGEGFMTFTRMLTGDHGRLKSLEMEDAIDGLLGLITLGSAWENVDVYFALQLCLRLEGYTEFADLAQLRLEELIEHGGKSFLPGSPAGETLRHWFTLSELPSPTKSIRGRYTVLRERADAWHTERIAFMDSRMNMGLHPDTDGEKFW
ncbi:hypothetical protein HYR69_11450, partial [Candidatus Sumerlaeota bacterium]|nr:hypothetical protein [Candidatus Sumerlaeota bacterium]